MFCTKEDIPSLGLSRGGQGALRCYLDNKVQLVIIVISKVCVIIIFYVVLSVCV